MPVVTYYQFLTVYNQIRARLMVQSREGMAERMILRRLKSYCAHHFLNKTLKHSDFKKVRATLATLDSIRPLADATDDEDSRVHMQAVSDLWKVCQKCFNLS